MKDGALPGTQRGQVLSPLFKVASVGIYLSFDFIICVLSPEDFPKTQQVLLKSYSRFFCSHKRLEYAAFIMSNVVVLNLQVAIRGSATTHAYTSDRTRDSVSIILPPVNRRRETFHMKFLEFMNAPKSITIAVTDPLQKNHEEALVDIINLSLGRSFAEAGFELKSDAIDGFFINYTSDQGQRLATEYFAIQRRFSQRSLEKIMLIPRLVICGCCEGRGHINSLIVVIKESAWWLRTKYDNGIYTTRTQIEYKDGPWAKFEGFQKDSTLAHIAGLESRNFKLQSRLQDLEAQLANSQPPPYHAVNVPPAKVSETVPVVLNSYIAVAYPAIEPYLTGEKGGQPCQFPLPFIDGYDHPNHLKYMDWAAAPPLITVFLPIPTNGKISCEDFVKPFNDAYSRSLKGIGFELDTRKVHGIFFTTNNALEQRESSRCFLPGDTLTPDVTNHLLRNRCDLVKECQCETDCACVKMGNVTNVSLIITWDAWDTLVTAQAWQAPQLTKEILDGPQHLVYRDDPFSKAKAAGSHAALLQIAHLESLHIGTLSQIHRLDHVLEENQQLQNELGDREDEIAHAQWLQMQLDNALFRTCGKQSVRMLYESYGMSEEDSLLFVQADDATREMLIQKYNLGYLHDDLMKFINDSRDGGDIHWKGGDADAVPAESTGTQEPAQESDDYGAAVVETIETQEGTEDNESAEEQDYESERDNDADDDMTSEEDSTSTMASTRSASESPSTINGHSDYDHLMPQWHLASMPDHFGGPFEDSDEITPDHMLFETHSVRSDSTLYAGEADEDEDMSENDRPEPVTQVGDDDLFDRCTNRGFWDDPWRPEVDW